MINVTRTVGGKREEQSNGDQDYQGYGKELANLSRVVMVDQIDKGTFEQSLDGSKGFSCACRYLREECSRKRDQTV